MHNGITRMLLVDNDATLLRDETSVNDIDRRARGYPLRETPNK
jgi:hypothetical protein